MPTHSTNITHDPASAAIRPRNTGIRRFAEPSPGPNAEDFTPSLPPSKELIMWDNLTPRERDVLNGIAQGHSNKQIASALGIGIGTVKAHVKRMFLKLGVNDRAIAPLVALGELEHAARMPRTRRGRTSLPLIAPVA